MNIHLTRYTASFLAMLFTLALGTSANAQPSAPDEGFDAYFAEMERTLSNPDTRLRMTKAGWDAYSENLEQALASGHEGVQQGALRMIIFYGDNLSISRAGVHDVVRIYRNHDDDRLRRMAVVALGQTRDAWGLDFLKRSAHFEKSSSIRHTINAVLAEAETIDPGPAKVGS